eukprot:gene11946-12035_t
MKQQGLAQLDTEKLTKEIEKGAKKLAKKITKGIKAEKPEVKEPVTEAKPEVKTAQPVAVAKTKSKSTKKLSVTLTILINNAGYGIFGNFDQLPLADQLNMLQLNIKAVVELTYLLLPDLKAQQQAYVLNVASTAAYQAVPSLALYSASKAFILSYSRAIRVEMKHTSVSVSCLCPGPTDTNFVKRAGMDAIADVADKFNMDPDKVAAIGLKGMFAKDPEIITGFVNKITAFAGRHLNKNFIERVTARLYKK